MLTVRTLLCVNTIYIVPFNTVSPYHRHCQADALDTSVSTNFSKKKLFRKIYKLLVTYSTLPTLQTSDLEWS